MKKPRDFSSAPSSAAPINNGDLFLPPINNFAWNIMAMCSLHPHLWLLISVFRLEPKGVDGARRAQGMKMSGCVVLSRLSLSLSLSLSFSLSFSLSILLLRGLKIAESGIILGTRALNLWRSGQYVRKPKGSELRLFRIFFPLIFEFSLPNLWVWFSASLAAFPLKSARAVVAGTPLGIHQNLWN